MCEYLDWIVQVVPPDRHNPQKPILRPAKFTPQNIEHKKKKSFPA
jgi:hypothetical protein